MYKEIDIGNDNSLILFYRENFWDKLIPTYFNNSRNIDVITYNFNFSHKEEKSFYNKLKELADKGVEIRLLYSKMTYSKTEELEIEEIFKGFVLCAELPENHAKIFVSDNVAFMGSANFSLGSNNNYESGILIRDTNIIKKIRREFVGELLEMSEFKNVPERWDDPFHHILGLKNCIDAIYCLMDNKENFYIDKNRELIPQLRAWSYIEKIALKLGITFRHHFDWEEFYYKIYDNCYIEEQDYYLFKDYIIKFRDVIENLADYFVESYEEKGRLTTLNELNIK
ncbi:phospholipase D-like domain-containing protein [Tissierella sp. Yu-01]|uniref:phospholipase D-like domain-containing protein n=1 Tax=Tissierella sp. Yu-01 TaxID=3035694 RepID=UPI00240E82DE|nr:phospholipase D-like domain-containing protein [Tissierella sp. Yu-01]WFA09594.1 phospholipase D-like domain-containing protein [Tissierella sp. Yu-01]